MPTILTFLIFFSVGCVHADQPQAAKKAIYDPGKANPDPTASYGNECARREEKHLEKVACYQCCVGESDSSTSICKKLKNHNNAKKNKPCGCEI